MSHGLPERPSSVSAGDGAGRPSALKTASHSRDTTRFHFSGIQEKPLSPEPSIVDRLAIRKRPGAVSLMHQSWGKLLFMHWAIEPEILRLLIPSQLSIDTFEGRAWIGVVPFTMWGIRASFLPPIPGTSAFHELNVRTYVHYDGVPGVWFFSLDAANRLAVWGARTSYSLPYFNATMSLSQNGNRIDYSSVRTDGRTYPQFFAADAGGFSADFASAQFQNPPQARLEASWTIGERLPQSNPGSLEFFLTERYCLYSYHRSRLYRSRIFHEPWSLHTASLDLSQSTMIESLGIAPPEGRPLLHYAESIAVDVWPLKRAAGTRP